MRANCNCRASESGVKLSRRAAHSLLSIHPSVRLLLLAKTLTDLGWHVAIRPSLTGQLNLSANRFLTAPRSLQKLTNGVSRAWENIMNSYAW